MRALLKNVKSISKLLSLNLGKMKYYIYIYMRDILFIYIDGTEITEYGVQLLADNMKYLPQLRTIDLSM